MEKKKETRGRKRKPDKNVTMAFCLPPWAKKDIEEQSKAMKISQSAYIMWRMYGSCS